ncbi:MAG TPA: I78 family peptidase inhibitor [Bordetella sp.]
MVSRLLNALMPLALTALLAGCAAPGSNGSSAAGATGGTGSYSSASYSGSASASGPDAPSKDCDAQPVQNMLGQAYGDSVGESVRQRSGSNAVRLLKPGQVMTMEYNPARINIILDAKGAIEALRCG